MHFSIDRIISGRAALVGEDGKPLLVPVEMLPPGSKSGDVVFYKNGVFLPALEKTEERRKQMAAMLQQLLRQRGDGGDKN